MKENKKKIFRLIVFWVIVILIGSVLNIFWLSVFFSYESGDIYDNFFSPDWMPLISNKFLYVMLLIFWSPFLQAFFFCLIRKLMIGKRRLGQIIRWLVIYEAIISPYIYFFVILCVWLVQIN